LKLGLDDETPLSSEHEHLLRGPTEIDLTYSGLEEVMCCAVEEVRQTAKAKQCSYRIAAYVNAIEKIHTVYSDSGFALWENHNTYFFV